MKRKPVTTFALIATILLTLSASVARVTAAPAQDFGFFSAGQFPLYVTDSTGDVVHQVDASGTASTYATGFNNPRGLAFDGSGNLYVADNTDDVVYLVPPGGGSKSTYATGFNIPRGMAFDGSGNLYVTDAGTDTVEVVPPGGGVASTLVALPDARWLAFTPLPPTKGGPHGDSSGSSTTDSSCWYSVNDNGFRGVTFDNNDDDNRATGGNDYCSTPITVTWDDYTMCAQAPSGYNISGLSINQSTWMDGDSCFTDKQGARVDIGLEKISTTNDTTNGAAVVADEPAAAAEAGFALGATGGAFGCAAAGSSQAQVTVPANVVADGTRFLCAASENPQSAAAPIGYSLVGSRVDLTTDTGLATFDSALTVCLSHTVADILKAGGAAANLRVGFFDGVMWQPLPLTSSSANETCGLTDHLTQFGLLAAIPTALPATGTSVAPIVWLVLAVVALVSGGIIWRRRLTA